MRKSPVSPSFLKQKAKQLKKAVPLKHNQALDEAAKLFGFANYKNYLNQLKTTDKQTTASLEAFLKDLLSKNDQSKEVDLAFPFIKKMDSFGVVMNVLKFFRNSDSVQSVCERLEIENEVSAYLLDDFKSEDGKAEIQSEQPYFVAKKILLRDVTYNLTNDALQVEGNYSLTAEFEYEVDDEDPNSKDDRFTDRELSGSFEVQIDKKKRITIENLDGGWRF